MMDDIAQIQSSIQAIKSQIASLSPAAPAPAIAGKNSFAQSLEQAQAPQQVDQTAGSEQTSGVAVPPASLGPLPVLPVSPTSAGVAPLTPTVSSVDNYSGLIQTYAAKNGIDPSLVRAVIQTESGGDPKAVSRVGAMGLMQLMPANASADDLTDPFDPEQNIAAGTQQLSGLLQKYHGNVDLALAAYNAGPGAVQKYGGVPPFQETQDYIRKIHAAMENK